MASLNFLGYFSPSGGQLLGLLAVIGVFILFTVLGGAVSGQRRLAPVDVFSGWGLVVSVFVLAGVFGPVPFGWLTAVLAAAALAAAWWSWRRGANGGINGAAFHGLWRVLVLASPLLLAVAAMKISQWDEFTQWLPNAKYILSYDAFPRTGLPESPSVFPSYPYALPLIVYLSSKLTGAFVENAGGLANLLLLLFFAPLYLDVVRRGLMAPSAWRHGWGAAALGILGVSVLSTVFVQKLVFTAYADSATAVLLGVLGIVGWRLLEKLADKAALGGALAWTLAWQFTLVSAVFLNLKQTNLVLWVILLAAMGLVALRDPKIRTADFLCRLPVLMLPGLAVYLAWRYHVTFQSSGREFSLLPFDAWLYPRAFDILGRMLLIASKKGAYFGMMTVISFFALRGLWRPRGSFGRLAVITGTVFMGNVLFMWFMYIAAFGAYEGVRAGGFWRYNTQLGLLGCTTAAYGVAILWRRHVHPRLGEGAEIRRLLSAAAIFLVLTAPLAAAKKIRFDIRPQKDHMRLAGQELGRSLPEGARLIIIDPHGLGFADKVINYEMTSGPGAGRGLSTLYRFRVLGKTAGELRQAFEKEAITHAWVHKPLAEVQKALNVELAARASHLLRYADSKWKLVRSWPYDGYEDPHILPD